MLAAIPRTLTVLACVLALIGLPPPPTGLASDPRVPALASIAGAVPRTVLMGIARRLGPLPSTRRLDLAIALAPRNERALDATIAAMYDSRSPLYHHYLAPAAVRNQFGPDPAAVADLTAWLHSQGLHVLPWDGGTVLDVQGSVARIGAAFHVRLWRYLLPATSGGRVVGLGHAECPAASRPFAMPLHRSSRGYGEPCPAGAQPPASAWVAGLAPDHDPLLPARYAALVRGVVGLATAGPLIGQARTGLGLTGNSSGYAPSQIAAAYDFQPLYDAGFHGEGTRVALLELAPYNAADIGAYAARYGVNPSITNVGIDGGNSGAPPSPEATLDIELLSTAAPGAAISVYNASNDGTLKSVLDALSAVAGRGAVQALVLTWANCESGNAAVAGFIDAEHTTFKLLAAQGATVVSASGDAGAFACAGDGQPSVVDPAGQPYTLAVGATDLTLTANGGIAAEVAWSCSGDTNAACRGLGAHGGGTGGGLSQYFHTGDTNGDDLSWQSGPGVANAYSNGYRQVPDVTFSGSLNIDNAHQYAVYYQGGWVTGGGTSTSAPMWAALILLADQYLLAQGGTPVGWVNPLIYRLGAATQPYPPYHDITSGNNLLYPATPGWDYASGWGSPDAWNVVRDLAAASVAARPTATATPSQAPPQATATTVPSRTPTATATASPSPTATATSSPLPTITGTATATATVTQTPVAAAAPMCPLFGIGNGGFETGNLTCWAVNSGIPPRIVTAIHFKSRYSAQIGALRAPQRDASVLRQDFLVPPGLAHPVLHFSYWLARTAPRGAHRPTSPVVTIFGPLGRVYARMRVLPHRDRVWSGFSVVLPECTGPACAAFRLELAVQVPPQPPGISEVLYLDDAYIGN